ncbi:polyketide synthase dehydratase domain-containing protein, partial [Enhygromyxa salina]|uniref:polyketide synthase dehydratase domain-containing protein n=1 Tax=Enhygromyxa salina TaxID=215803 RepID=UPI0011BA61A7
SARSLNAGGPVFRVKVRADHPVLRDHCIAGRMILPGVATIELALAALELVAPGRAPCLEQLCWLRPLEAGPDGLELFVGIRRGVSEGDEPIEIDIETELGVHAQLLARFELPTLTPEPAPAPASTSASSFMAADFYASLARASINYGPWYRCVSDLQLDAEGVLARLELPDAAQPSYCLHPALADAALQSVAGFLLDPTNPGAGGPTSVAVSVARVVVASALPSRCWARVRERDAGVYDVALFDDDGRVYVRFEGLHLQTLGQTHGPTHGRESATAFAPRWEPVTACAPVLVNDCALLVGPGVILEASVEVHPVHRLAAEPSVAALEAALAELSCARLVYCVGANGSASSIAALVQALDLRGRSEGPLELVIVSAGAQQLPGYDPRAAELPGSSAALSGVAAVLTRERPRWRVWCVDVERGAAPTRWMLPAAPL